MPGAAKRVFTFDEIYAQIARLPEGVTGEILAPGVLSTMSRPGLAHAHTADMVADALRRQGDSRFGGRGWRTAVLPPFETEMSVGSWWRA
ncbi:MAG TPA: hypothetical protein VIJ22_07970 [Polyangiaceae bacterium]